MTDTLVCLLAVLLDIRLGEPKRGHPVTAFARLAARLQPQGLPPAVRGFAGWALLVLPPAAAVTLVASVQPVGLPLEVLVLYLALGGARLLQQARVVQRALVSGDRTLGRSAVSWITGARTESWSEQRMVSESIASLLRNGNTALFAPLFWYTLLGIGGALTYRLTHVLARVWRDGGAYAYPARAVGIAMSWPAAQLTAAAYLLVGNVRRAWRSWRRGRRRDGEAALLSAGAGALAIDLDVRLQELSHAPLRVGQGLVPRPADIGRAAVLVQHALWLWLAAIAVVDLITL